MTADELESVFEKAEYFYENMNFKKALKLFSEIEPFWPDFTVSNYIGCCYLGLENYDKAESIFKTLIVKAPDWERPYFNLARICMKTGRFKEAYQLLRESIEINPNSGDSYFYMGLYHKKKEEWLKAIECFLYADKYNGLELETQLNLTCCYEKIGEREKALFCAKQALAVAPNDLDALSNMVWLLTNSGNYREAFDLLYKNREELSDNIAFLKLLFGCAKRLGRDDICEKTAEQIFLISKEKFESSDISET